MSTPLSGAALTRRATKLRRLANAYLAAADKLEAEAKMVADPKPTKCADVVRDLLPRRGHWTVTALVNASGFQEGRVRQVLATMREAGEVEHPRYGWWSATETLLRASTAGGTVAV